MNFEIPPAAPCTPLRILTLPSGAVSSSWMWNRLTSVLMVMAFCLRCLSAALRGRYPAFTLLLAYYLPVVSKVLDPGHSCNRITGSLDQLLVRSPTRHG